MTVDRAVAKAYARMRTAALMIERGGPPEGLIVSATIDERRLGRWECCGFGDRTACSNKECLIHDSGYPVPSGLVPNELSLQTIKYPEFASRLAVLNAYRHGVNWRWALAPALLGLSRPVGEEIEERLECLSEGTVSKGQRQEQRLEMARRIKRGEASADERGEFVRDTLSGLLRRLVDKEEVNMDPTIPPK